VYLLLRGGLLSLAAGIFTTTVLHTLPITSDFSGRATGGSVFILCGVAALALYGFRTTLAGRRLLPQNFAARL
jgi:hypothetical protein